MKYINTVEALFGANGAYGTISSRFNRFQRLYFRDFEPISPIWDLKAARGKTKETIFGIEVAYDIYKHLRSVYWHKWSLWIYF